MGKYFGTDGVRGVANKTLTCDMAFRIGRFLGNYAKNSGTKKIVVGKDTRVSSSMFENILAGGIAASGCDTYLIGYCSTPCLAFVAEHDEFALGVMISASHNPYYDNGIKVFSNDGVKFKDDILDEVEKYMDVPEGIDYAVNDEIGQIYSYSQEGLNHYKDWIKDLYQLDLSKYNILLDCANGSNSFIAYQILTDLGANVSALNCHPNGININNNCGSTHLDFLKEEIKKGEYNIGFAFDGDADRIQVVDSKGHEVNGDIIMYVIAKYLKENNLLNKNKVVVTGYSNIGLHKALKQLDIETEVVENGDRYVLECMLNNDYSLGGEQSGHIIIKKDCNFGDGLKSGLCLLNALIYFDKDIEELEKEINIYPQLLVNQKVRDKNTVMNDSDILAKIEEVKTIIGDNGQLLVRPSGTEPLVRVMAEAENDELCNSYVYAIIDAIKAKGYAND